MPEIVDSESAEKIKLFLVCVETIEVLSDENYLKMHFAQTLAFCM